MSIVTPSVSVDDPYSIPASAATSGHPPNSSQHVDAEAPSGPPLFPLSSEQELCQLVAHIGAILGQDTPYMVGRSFQAKFSP